MGAGTGLNLELYPDAVTDLILAEPDPHMIKQLRKRVAELGIAARASSRPGPNSCPFEDDSFDTAVVDPGPLHGPRPRGGAAPRPRGY